MTNRFKKLVLLLGDILCFVLAICITTFINKPTFEYNKLLEGHLIFTLFLTPIWVVIFFIEGLYSLRTFNRNGLIVSLLRSISFSSIISIIFLYLFGNKLGVSPKTNLIIFSFLTLVLTYIWRRVFFKIFTYKVFTRDVTFIGTTSEFNEIKENIEQRKHLGFKLKSEYDCFSKVIIYGAPQLVVVEDGLLKSAEVGFRLFESLNKGASILSLSEFSEIVLGKVPLNAIDHTWFIDSKISINQGTYYYTKVVFDKIIAIFMAILALPILILITPILLITSGRPLIYSQKRVGEKNKNFTIYKLRTMTINAEKNGAQWAIQNDSRITPMGKFLRKTRIDELPQLWNVIIGNMSIVGPRPERPEIIEDRLKNVIPFYDYRHLVKPGITGWAQVNYGYGASEEDSLEKLRYDLYYIKNKSHWLDVRIILKTIRIVLKKIGR
ncbi:exopolysaccharide biosynthesis polyprenyl glycosylphosphotransferase [Halobacteriovorax sp.]|uniref:exopolysaccharide biosynthesis polyprenyl glycosylphosphotransferase n=1 Tax=Halobacteriovorax sp. TaxID=2020862 RepID=UPI003AF24FB4